LNFGGKDSTLFLAFLSYTGYNEKKRFFRARRKTLRREEKTFFFL